MVSHKITTVLNWHNNTFFLNFSLDGSKHVSNRLEKFRQIQHKSPKQGVTSVFMGPHHMGTIYICVSQEEIATLTPT